MKQVIQNRLYDTDKAKKLAEWDDGKGIGSFAHVVETLYRKRTGEYFLHGVGGPASRFARSVGQNEWTGGEKIIPMSYDKAREWAEQRLDVDDYEKIFGLPDEDERATLVLQVPAALAQTLRAQAAKEQTSVAAYVTRILEESQK